MADDEEKTDRQSHEKKPFFSGLSENLNASFGNSSQGPGGKIGPYKLLSILGEGGYGVVYLAEQQKQIKRQVALKIIKPGMDTKEVIARFEAERQALALLDHSNIAHIYDAGVTGAGLSYFVMEYIKGVPITEHCDKHKLSIEDRLKLFLQVCEGIHFAHQKGIIHRDIKPSNILMSFEGKKAIPKVIDFGIAKALSQPLTERTLHTERGQFIGTPEYMCPEQAEITTRDIDTRSDVYSLGVVLYELLIGVLPFDPHTLRDPGIDRLRQVIRKQEPKTPSIRLWRLGEKAEQIAAKRRTGVGALVKCLHKELEWIPMKAMRKERTHRYQSVSELADDIRSYLNGNPLIAAPESATYRIKKYIRKRRRLVTAAAAVMLAILAGFIVSTTMYFRVERQRKEAESARINEEKQRKVADMERERALRAEGELQKQLAIMYEQRGLSRLSSNRVEEAIIFFNEAYQLDPERFSIKFLLSDAMRRWADAQTGSKTALIPWRTAEKEINPSGYTVSPRRNLVALTDFRRENVYIFQTDNGEFKSQLSADNVEHMVFTQDKRYLILRTRPVGANDYRLQIIKWETETVIVDKILSDPKVDITQVCQDEKIYAPDLKQHQIIHNSLYMSRSGRWLAVPEVDIRLKTTNAYLFDVKSKKPPKNLPGFPSLALKMAFSPDEKTFAMINWRYAPTHLWDVDTGKFRRNTWVYPSVLFDAVSPKDAGLGIRAATAYSGLWATLSHDGGNGRTWKNSIWAGFSPKGDRFVTKQIGPWNPNTTEEYPPGILWDTATESPLADLSGQELRNWYFTPDSGLLVTVHNDDEMRIWNTQDGNLNIIIPPEEGRLVVDISPDSDWLLTRSGKADRITKMWNLTKGTGFELPLDQCLDMDLAKGWLNRQNDHILQFSRETPNELPRFNANGSKIITAVGLRDVSCNISSPEEAEAWVQAKIPLRWGDGYLRTPSVNEMLNAKVQYSTLTRGSEDPCTVSLRLEMMNHRCRQLISVEKLEEASKVVKNIQSLAITIQSKSYQNLQQIFNQLSTAYFKQGERASLRGKYSSALASYKAVVEIHETNAEAWRRLAWLQIAFPDYQVNKNSDVLAGARKACVLTEWKDPHSLSVLAAAYAKVDDFGEAIRCQQKSLDLLSTNERPRWQANFQKRLELYQANHRYDKRRFWDVPIEHLVAWWKLDEHAGDIAIDSSGNAHHGTLVGNPTWETGIIGGGLFLEGGVIDRFQYIRCGNSPAFNMMDAITISGWMKVKRFKERHEPIITKGDNSWGLRKWRGTDKMCFGVSVLNKAVSTESRMVSVKGRTGVEDNKWHHVVGVFDGEQAFLYIDGILDGTVSAPGLIKTDDFEVFIGQSSGNPLHRQWHGLIDEVRVYDRALMSEEVIELFYSEEGIQNNAPIARAFGPLCLIYPENTVQVDATIIDDGRPYEQDGLTLDWSLLSGPDSVKFLPSSKVEDPCVVFPKPGAYELLLTASDGEKDVTEVLRVAVYPKDFDGLLAHYTFDNGKATNSSSIDGLHGKLVGNAVIMSESLRGSVLNLTNGGYVDCGSDVRFDTLYELTLAAWVRVGDFVKTGQQIISKQRSWHLYKDTNRNRAIFVCVGVQHNRPEWNNISSTAIVADGGWHHIAGVFNGKEMRLYIDGVLDKFVVAIGGEINFTKAPVRIGHDTSQSSIHSNMFIDDVRMYNRALSSEEIVELYNETK